MAFPPSSLFQEAEYDKPSLNFELMECPTYNVLECIQVLKNIKTVTRCRDSRTAKSKETR